MMLQLLLALALGSASHAAKYEQYILAPSSRTLHPVSVYQVNGSVLGAGSLASDVHGSAIFKDQSAVTYDFRKVMIWFPYHATIDC